MIKIGNSVTSSKEKTVVGKYANAICGKKRGCLVTETTSNGFISI